MSFLEDLDSGGGLVVGHRTLLTVVADDDAEASDMPSVIEDIDVVSASGY